MCLLSRDQLIRRMTSWERTWSLERCLDVQQAVKYTMNSCSLIESARWLTTAQNASQLFWWSCLCVCVCKSEVAADERVRDLLASECFVLYEQLISRTLAFEVKSGRKSSDCYSSSSLWYLMKSAFVLWLQYMRYTSVKRDYIYNDGCNLRKRNINHRDSITARLICIKTRKSDVFFIRQLPQQ